MHDCLEPPDETEVDRGLLMWPCFHSVEIQQQRIERLQAEYFLFFCTTWMLGVETRFPAWSATGYSQTAGSFGLPCPCFAICARHITR